MKCLYLHGNKLYDLTEIDKLTQLKELTVLTLHGNPIENLPGYRHYILLKLPKLKHLNFAGISRNDKMTAAVQLRTNKHTLRIETQQEKDAAEAAKNKKYDED